MNIITKHPVDNLGYNFIDQKYFLQEKMNIICEINRIRIAAIIEDLLPGKKKFLSAVITVLMTGVKFLFQKHLIRYW